MPINNLNKKGSDFLGKAPDAPRTAPKRKPGSTRVVISYSIHPEDLAELDALADKLHKTRSGLLSDLIREGLAKMKKEELGQG